jgi:DNA-binding response OmpR family regulator
MSYVAIYPRAARQSPPQQVALGNDMQPKKEVLIVDDEAPIAQLLADVLHDEGYHVRVARDGASALLEILKRPPGLVLLDVAMPVMLGSDLLVYLRQHGFTNLPIIIMTAGLSPAAYLAQGATEVMPKPFDVNVVVDKVARYLPLEHGRAANS